MSHEKEISRRTVLGGMATSVALPALAAKALCEPSNPALESATRAHISAEGGQAIPVPRHLHAAAVLQDGRVLVTGGYVGSHRGVGLPTDSAQIFDAVRNTWTDAAPMLTARARHSAVLLPDGRIAVMGGYTIGALDSVEIYDPSLNAWTYGPALPSPICDHTAVVSHGAVVIHGGSSGAAAHVLAINSLSRGDRP